MNHNAANKLGRSNERGKHMRPIGKRISAKKIRRALLKERE